VPDTELPLPEIPWPPLAHPPLQERFGVLKPIANFDPGPRPAAKDAGQDKKKWG
jgi:hypothetical protein